MIRINYNKPQLRSTKTVFNKALSPSTPLYRFIVTFALFLVYLISKLFPFSSPTSQPKCPRVSTTRFSFESGQLMRYSSRATIGRTWWHHAKYGWTELLKRKISWESEPLQVRSASTLSWERGVCWLCAVFPHKNSLPEHRRDSLGPLPSLLVEGRTGPMSLGNANRVWTDCPGA